MLSKYLNEHEMTVIQEAGYGENGLRFTLKELEATDPSRMTMEDLAEYADAITYAKTINQDADFFLPQLQPIPEGRTVTITTTGLGNLAHIAIHFKDERVKNVAVALFRQLHNAVLLDNDNNDNNDNNNNT